MRRSEFFSVLDEVYGTYGRSLIVDLYLPQIQNTAFLALEEGVDPQVIWAALIEETDRDPELVWLHRADPKKRRH